MVAVDRFRSESASPGQLESIRRLCDEAFGGRFTEEDWRHALGGWHVAVTEGDDLVAHAAVVARELRVGGGLFNAGYVEAVVTRPGRRRQGYGTLAMREIESCLKGSFDLGALSTGAHAFYERLGWRRWAGSTFVETALGPVRTEDEDDGVMVLTFGPSADVSLDAAICCRERPGDDW